VTQSLNSIVPVILAAGDSKRMGYPKAILPLGEDIFITRILKTIGKIGLPHPIIVLGKTAAEIRTQIQNWDAEIIINPNPERGQLSSIQLGLSCIHSDFSAGMIWPVDQPTVSDRLVLKLVRLFLSSGSLIAIPSYGNRRGHPTIFHRTLFQEFMEISLEESPKKILLRHNQSTAVLPTEELAIIQDIDTPAEYKALTGESLESALARTYHRISEQGCAGNRKSTACD
jgi:molybdenum cofactor cytidylyltransferase